MDIYLGWGALCQAMNKSVLAYSYMYVKIIFHWAVLNNHNLLFIFFCSNIQILSTHVLS